MGRREDTSDLSAMLATAEAARRRAYAPYSGFAVGCCLQAEGGRLYGGCNVENASYPLGQCAEAAALGALVAGGDRRIAAILLLTAADPPATPCGGCLQRLSEFAGPEVPVHLCGTGGARRTVRLRDLLPHPFASAARAAG